MPFSRTSLSTALVLCAAAPFAQAQNTAEAEQPLTLVEAGEEVEVEKPPTFLEALGSGKAWMSFRYRIENVDQANFGKEAYASTLRTTLGYETAKWNGVSLLFEAEDVSSIGNELYNSTTNGVTDRPVVADPTDTEVNQTYLRYTGWKPGDAKIGRQVIDIDNQRFVGSVPWRQNYQTFDAWSLLAHAPGDVDVYASWVTNTNRVVGDQNPAGNAPMDTALLNASHEFEGVGMLNAYFYNLDYREMVTLSTQSFGASFQGKSKVSEKSDLVWRAELAQQVDTGDNPLDIDQMYSHLFVGGNVSAVQIRVGWEVLGGSGDPGDAFQTPLATLHKFNGWADQFLVTPDGGLDDVYLSVGGKWRNNFFQVVLHDFSSDSGGIDYGTEIDLLATRSFKNGMKGGLKYADYSADDFSVDTKKAWVWIQYAF